MKKLKTILQSNKFFYLLFILALLYTVFYIKFDKYDAPKNKKYAGYITDYNIDGDKLTINLKSDENLIINYYFKTEKEKNNFDLSYGDYIRVYGKIIKPSENTNFYLFNYKKYLLSKKIRYIVNSTEIELIKRNDNILYKFKKGILNRIEKCKNTKKYIKAFIIGDKKEIDSIYYESYQFLGISHLLAVSGMHVSLVSMIILRILKKKIGNISYIIVSIVLLFYLFLTNYTISMIRATFQFMLFSINTIMKLNIKSHNIVIFLVSILFFYNPYYIYDVGFKFSFIISFSLILCKNVISKRKKYITKSLMVSSISFFVSIPILINNFNKINFLSIIYNLFYVPFVSYIIFPFSLFTLIFPALDNLYFKFVNIFENVSITLNKIKILSFDVANIPMILIIIYYIIIYFLIFKCSKKKIIMTFIMFVLIINYKKTVLTKEIVFMDVGQGDSTLIRIKDENVLIDTGGKFNYKIKKWKQKRKKYTITKNILVPYFKKQGIKKINYLILTHGDYDHMGEAINLVNNFKVDNVIFNCGLYNNLEKDLIKVLDKKRIKYYSCIKELKIDKNKLYFFQTKEYDNENDNSNVIYTELDGYNFMFMGDAGIEVEEDLIEKYNLKDIDVLKVGHHGSRTSSSKEFIDEINPRYSVISVGKSNRYGHPNDNVLDNLEDSKIYRTDQDGSIMFKIKNNKLEIETCAP